MILHEHLWIVAPASGRVRESVPPSLWRRYDATTAAAETAKLLQHYEVDFQGHARTSQAHTVEAGQSLHGDRDFT